MNLLMPYSLYKYIGILLITACSLGCKKLVEVNAPVTSTNSANVYQTDATATAVLTSIYANMSASSYSMGSSLPGLMSLYAALSADELTAFSGAGNNYLAYYKNALSSSTAPNIWDNLYPVIYILNSAEEGLEKSTTLTPQIMQQLLGEVRFMRAFSYFYLTNLYGDVPLITGTDYNINSIQDRKAQAEIYQQIFRDLISAQSLLSTNYLNANLVSTTTDRVRPTSAAATALLARAYLFKGEWANAEMQASAVINNTLYDTVSLNSVFLKNSKEAIWQLQPVNTGWNSEDARIFVLPSSGVSGSYPVTLSTQLLNSFDVGDRRAVAGNWVQQVSVGSTTYYFPYKYKSAKLDAPITEYHTVLRLAEQYLIRAEARAQQDKLSEARADLNLIRTRAGIPNTMASSKSDILSAVQHERQVELFTEWGHRWLDLKRTNNVDAVMSVVTPLKGGSWDKRWKLYPISGNELLADPKLVQNDGY